MQAPACISWIQPRGSWGIQPSENASPSLLVEHKKCHCHYCSTTNLLINSDAMSSHLLNELLPPHTCSTTNHICHIRPIKYLPSSSAHKLKHCPIKMLILFQSHVKGFAICWAQVNLQITSLLCRYLAIASNAGNFPDHSRTCQDHIHITPFVNAWEQDQKARLHPLQCSSSILPARINFHSNLHSTIHFACLRLSVKCINQITCFPSSSFQIIFFLLSYVCCKCSESAGNISLFWRTILFVRLCHRTMG